MTLGIRSSGMDPCRLFVKPEAEYVGFRPSDTLYEKQYMVMDLKKAMVSPICFAAQRMSKNKRS